MHQLSLGVVARSRKENERRLPIHPHHLDRIDADLRKTIYLEHGYGEPFGVPDEQLAGMVAGMRTREQLVAECEVILLAKPLREDVAELRTGHAVFSMTPDHCGRARCRTSTVRMTIARVRMTIARYSR
ncbi:hypothetical protein ABZ413_34090 [Nocardia rhamnosiphila]|uniref:hypothetical protein n=1 Tax=Nocardia rhamnosiphila TaxID=426716 RepID=UPI0033CF23EB